MSDPLSAANEFLNLPAAGPMTDEQRSLLATVEALAPLRPETPRDGNGRYRLPHPVTSKDASTTRATTFISALEGGHMLEGWIMRQTAIGVAAHPDLAERIVDAASGLGTDDAKKAKQLLNGLAERAKTLSGADINREVGTALHAVAERLDHGIAVQVPAVYVADLTARAAALDNAGLTNRPPEYRERVVTLPDLKVTGTTDGITVDGDGTAYIFDDKFGATMDYAWAKTAAQLALYAHAPYMWDHEAQKWVEMPAVSQEWGYVCHTPAGTGTSTVYRLDLTVGWELVEMCQAVRAHQAYAAKITRQGPELVATHERSRAVTDLLAETVDLFATENAGASHGADDPAPLAPGQTEVPAPSAVTSVENTVGAPATPTAPEAVAPVVTQTPDATASTTPHAGGPAPMDDTATRSAWITARLRTIRDTGNELAMRAIRQYWPADTPFKAPWSDQQIAELDELLVHVERLDDIPFTGHDPTAPPIARLATATPEPQPERQAPVTERPIVDDGSRPSPDQIAELTALVRAPAAAARGTVTSTWVADAKRAQRPWSNGPSTMTMRLWAIQMAVVAVTTALIDGDDTDDSLVRCALADVLGLDAHSDAPGWTGAVLGSLTFDEAVALRTTAASFQAGDAEAVARLGGRLSRQFAQAS